MSFLRNIFSKKTNPIEVFLNKYCNNFRDYDTAAIVQSVGRMIDANWKLMENSKIIVSIRQLYEGVHADFFGYEDDGQLRRSSISISFQVSTSKVINENLIPDLSPYEETLLKLRLEFEEDERQAQEDAKRSICRS